MIDRGGIKRFVIGSLLIASPLTSAGELETVRRNKEALQAVEREDLTAAEKHFLGALAEDPFNPVLRLNLGWTFETQKQYEKALKEYGAVARAEKMPDDLRFIAHFNAGNAAAQLKNKDLALEHYQKALDIKPNSKETKTNIELLMQQGGGPGQGGEGEGQGENKPDDQQGQDPKENPGDSGDNKKEKPKFDSKNLTQEDVRKILEELKSQEQKIRALEYGGKGKESSPEKDW